MSSLEFYLKIAEIAGNMTSIYMSSNPTFAQKDPKDPTRVASQANCFDSIVDNLIMVRIPSLISGKSLSGPMPAELKAMLDKASATGGNLPANVNVAQLAGLTDKFTALEALVRGLIPQQPAPTPSGPVTVPGPTT